MEELIQTLRRYLADSFIFYVKAQNYHWNIEGKDFPQYHDFFGKLYSEVQSSIDTTAEEIRALGEYSPGSLKRFIDLSQLTEEVTVPQSLRTMLDNLYKDNNSIVTNLSMAFKLADNLDQQGVADYIAGRIDAHKKHAWMLRSSIKGM